ncbi:peptidylprolyl isomerase [Persicirhabdus sediminis]|uniref:peptidylprolyl isomerase n=1 Tax=Persicirhabdus sediminis TaxID=454144 RepID=A0A8J7MEY3_9BACT|nr:peptidylprolyl isomerase [Persicirhabdus sediminis]MBK1791450.1 peptidylprolyl isomerase [Persicirhabdus sediminis]
MRNLTIALAMLSMPLTLAAATKVNGIAVKVNGTVITNNEINFQLTPLRDALSAQMPNKGPAYDKIIAEQRNKIIDNLIDRELILYEFKARGAFIPPHVIDDEIKKEIRNLYNGSEEEFHKALRSAGLTQQQHRRETEKKIKVQAMRANFFSDSVPPLPQEVQAEYNENKLQMRDRSGDELQYSKIDIPKIDPERPDSTQESQFKLAEDVAKQLNDGADFAELAKRYSVDSRSDQGGEWPMTKRTDLSPAFANILMDEADIGKIVGPLDGPLSFTIVRVNKKKYGPVPPLSEVRGAMENRVRAEKNKVKHDRWIERLRKKAMISRM